LYLEINPRSKHYTDFLRPISKSLNVPPKISELAVFVSAFKSSVFTGSINWYRNLDRNWHLLGEVNPIIQQPTLMIYGNLDMIPKSERLPELVPNVDVVSLDCGHWIQQELPEETNQVILKWLKSHNA
jgi:pimeloyl-ACP methyl ester carboxylesterase